MMTKNLLKPILIFSLIFFNSIFVITVSSSENNELSWWDESYSFREEIKLPIVTNSEQAKYQPIDISLNFKDVCWAKNEKTNSVRVLCWIDNSWNELESQVYNLTFNEEGYLKRCNIVFLIPVFADGSERYFIYYDDEIKESANYVDHVDISDEYIYQEVIPGYSAESNFYQINEDGKVVYAVVQEGQFLGTKTSQQIIKLKPESSRFLPKNGRQMISLEFKYWYVQDKTYLISSGEKLFSKKILVDGNLMVKFGIISRSNDDRIQTTCYYKYYYSPIDNKRIYTHVKNDIIKYPMPESKEITLNFVTSQLGGLKSTTLKDLNYGGNVPKYLHVYSEEERVLKYNINQYPESRRWNAVIPARSDCDIGSESWISFDNGETGESHGLIFDSTDIIKSGKNERQGLQLTQYESKIIQLPGLDSRLIYTSLSRNSYESNSQEDNEIPKDFVVEFNLDFFSSEEDGYNSVRKEAEIFRDIIKYQPVSTEDIEPDEENIEYFNLTTIIHKAPAFPLGSLFSALTGKNLPYISVELYNAEKFLSSVIGRRIQFDEMPNFEDKKAIEKIKTALDFFDFKNSSLFKKAYFKEIPAGNYIVKVYRENSLLKHDKKIIGLKLVELNSDEKINIFCGLETFIDINVLNREGEGLKNVSAKLFKDDFLINEIKTDGDGKGKFFIPFKMGDKYNIKLFYKGFLLKDENVQLKYFDLINPQKTVYNADTNDFQVKILTSDGKTPEFETKIELISENMVYNTLIKPDEYKNGIYYFKNLITGTYNLSIHFKNFDIKEKIDIPEKSSFNVNLVDLKLNFFDDLNLSMDAALDVTLKDNLLDGNFLFPSNKTAKNVYLFKNIYPSNYDLKIRYNTYDLVKNVDLTKNKSLDIEIVFPVVLNQSFTILDNRGNPLKDAKLVFEREKIKITKNTNNDGLVQVSLPPGSYNLSIFKDNKLIGKRCLSLIHDESLVMVTTQPSFAIDLFIISLILVGIILSIYFIKKRNLIVFFKIMAIVIAIIAILMPWWALNGTSSNFDHETKMFLVPTEMVSLTSDTDVLIGETSTLDKEFSSVIELIPLIIIVGCTAMILSIILQKKHKFLSSLSLISGLGTFIISFSIFYIAMSQLAYLCVGSFSGSGNIEFFIPGHSKYVSLSSSWGPSLGFYLILLSIILTIITIIYSLKIGYFKNLNVKNKLISFFKDKIF